ncbi:hypothetical protein PFISCL1PPCAC_1694, partial [Pristionchus fissidentatus]
EIRRRIVRYFKGKINVEGFSGRSDLKTDDNPNKIRCLLWNCCGFVGQTVRTPDNSLLTLVAAIEPDIIILNEIKAKEGDFANVVRAIEGYEYLSIPSSAPKGRSMRGTAIVYRKCSKFSIKRAGQEEFGSDKNAPVIEALAVDLQMTSGPKYRLIGSYVRGENKFFDEALEIYKKLSINGGTTIVAGDLNMDKNKFVGKWKTGGFIDSLASIWATNRTRKTLTSIDYVMQSGKKALICHRPIQPDDDSVHFP